LQKAKNTKFLVTKENVSIKKEPSYNNLTLPTLRQLNTFSCNQDFETDISFYPQEDGQGYVFAITIFPVKDNDFPIMKQNFIFLLDRSNAVLHSRITATRQAIANSLNYLRKNNKRRNIMREIVKDKEMVAYCGLYCGACPQYLKEKCEGCMKNVKATWCKIRKCCIKNNFVNYENVPDPASPYTFGLVPTEKLSPLREFDRAAEPAGRKATGPDNIKKLADHMAEGGRWSDPTAVSYYPDQEWAYLAEGNHRLALAEALGLEQLPATVWREKGLPLKLLSSVHNSGQKVGRRIGPLDTNQLKRDPYGTFPGSVGDFYVPPTMNPYLLKYFQQ